jgi:hypothetical protein
MALDERQPDSHTSVQYAHQLAPELAYRLACAGVLTPRHR